MIDLHIHSTFSDGTYSPKELVSMAHNLGLTAIALTDHDTVSGLKACQQAALHLPLQVITGIELSVSYGGHEYHLLGYDFDPSHPQLLGYLAELKLSRSVRTLQILRQLQNCGLELSLQDITGTASAETIITRAHFASALLKKGYVAYQQQAFERYLGEGKPAFIPKESLLPISEAITLIHQAGGKAILAHPTLYKISRTHMLNVIQELIKLGLDGLECYYPSYTVRQNKDFLVLCQKHQLLATGGSDFHGMNHPKIQLGSGYGQLEVPHSLLNALLTTMS
ncbi:MAG: PHP domain-containing protein [Cellulosilyticaceae bacterium]